MDNNDQSLVKNLEKALRLDWLSVSEKYPNDDGCLRRMTEWHLSDSMTFKKVKMNCSVIAEAFGGRFCNDVRIVDNDVRFVIAYDDYVDPPNPCNVRREDPV